MKSAVVRIALQASSEQLLRIEALQRMFASACNALAPMVQQTRCWNRVALHHMAYKQLRERFPELGSQMVCNVIYSVSRTSRAVYQGAGSPFNIAKLGARPLPQIQFVAHAPVYFDRHTLSLKDGVVSLFTLDGRMRFQLNLRAADEKRFREDKLREIVLSGSGQRYALSFEFGRDDDTPAASDAATEWPQYALVADGVPPLTLPLPAARIKEARPR